MFKFLKINEEDLPRVEEVLKEEEIPILGTWSDAWGAFVDQEAEFRVNMYEEEENVKLPDNIKEDIIIELCDRYYYNDILNYDYMDSLRNEVINDCK